MSAIRPSPISQRFLIDEECPECDGAIREDEKRGEFVCQDCGLVVADGTIDHGPEWRSYDNEEGTKKRTCEPSTHYHDKNLGSEIGGNVDASGNPIPGHRQIRLSRMRTLANRGEDSKAEGLRYCLNEIHRIASLLNLPEDVHDRAVEIHRKATDEDLLPGRRKEAMVGAAIFISCRESGIVRTYDTIEDAIRDGDSSGKKIRRAVLYLSSELEGVNPPPIKPVEVAPQIVGQVDGSPEEKSELLRITTALLEIAEEDALFAGASPKAVAGGVLYFVAQRVLDDPPSQEATGELVDTTDVTIRKHKDTIKTMVEEEDVDFF